MNEKKISLATKAVIINYSDLLQGYELIYSTQMALGSSMCNLNRK